MFNKYSREICVDVVADGGIANVAFAEGRILPVLIVDKRPLPALDDYLRAHEHNPPGDVVLQWAQPTFSSKTVFLRMTVTRPTDLVFAIAFDVSKQYSLVDSIIHSRGFYLQTGMPGDRVSATMGATRIIVEVPDLGFFPQWDRILSRNLSARFRKRGLSKKEANEAVKGQMRSMRELWELRAGSQARGGS